MTSTRKARLVGDIGGTNARFALLDHNGIPQQPGTLKCSDYPTIESAIEQFLADSDATELSAAAIAVATPVNGDAVKLTNGEWNFSISQTRSALALETLEVMNDFTALALSVPHLGAGQRRQVGGGSPEEEGVIGIIGPGTGLGVSALVPLGDDRHKILSREGGHVSVSLCTEREIELYRVMAGRYDHVSAERFLSGPGIVEIHNALRVIDGLEAKPLEPAAITSMALSDEDPVCAETLQLFCAQLGTCAGNMALILDAGAGIYIGGGIVPRLGEYFERSAFRERFEHKGRMSRLLKRIPTYVITAPYPALTGAAQVLLNG